MRVKTPIYLQKEAAECGAVALRIILAYYGRFVPIQDLRNRCQVSRDGVRGDKLKQAAEHYDLETHVFRRSATTLREENVPFVAFTLNKHFVVVEGFKARQVYINDPALGRYSLQEAEFNQQFGGIIFSFKPNTNFQRGGTKTKLLLKLNQFSQGSQLVLITDFVVALILAALSLSQIGLLRSFFEDLIANDAPILIPLLLLCLFLGGLSIGFIALIQIQRWHTSNRIAVLNASRLFWQMMNLPLSFFRGRAAGELAAQFSWTRDIARFISSEMLDFLASLVSSIALLAVLFIYDAVLAIINMMVMGIYLLCFLLLSRPQNIHASFYLNRWGKFLGAANFYLRQVESVKALGAENEILLRLQAFGVDILHAQQSLMQSTQFLTILAFCFGIAQQSLMIFIGALRVADGSLSIGAFTAVQSLSMLVWIPLSRAVKFPGLFQVVRHKLELLEDITLEQSPLIKQVISSSNQRGIRVENLSFGYDKNQAPILDQLNLSLDQGEIVALLGISGSGKSSLARLLAGIETAWSGSIECDGAVLVDSDISIFEGSLWENLSLWDVSISRKDLAKAVADSELELDIQRLPGGYASAIAADGMNFSGGQRQRIQIARALAKNPEILILDEATNAIDSGQEKRILNNLRSRGCTCLIITHRLSTAQEADRILVLNQGKIVESGSHKSLMAESGLYAQFHQSKALKFLPVADSTAFSQEIEPISQANPTISAPFHNLLESRFEPLFMNLNPHSEMLAACQIVLRNEGFELATVDYGNADTAAIAAINQFYLRPIRLDFGWEKRDAGSLLLDGDSPKALLYKNGVYHQAEPKTQRLHIITADAAVGLKTAYQISLPLSKKADARVWDILRTVWRNCLKDSWIVLLCSVFVALAQLMPVLLISPLLDSILIQGSANHLIQIALILFLSMLLGAIFLYAQQLAQLSIATRIGLRMHNGFWAQLLNSGIRSLNQFSVGDLIARSNGIDSFLGAVTTGISSFFSGLSFIAILVFILFTQSDLGIVLGLTALLYTAIIIPILWMRLNALHDVAELEARNQNWLTTVINGIQQIQSDKAGERAFAKWVQAELPIRDAEMKAEKMAIWIKVINEGLVWMLLFLFFLLISRSTTSLSIGTLIGLQTAFLMAGVLLAQIGQSLSASLTGPVAFRRLKPLLALKAESPGDSMHRLHRLQGSIRIENLTVRYQPEGQAALERLSLEIDAGEFIAIVGASGSGKTTLIRALLAFEKAESGQVFYDEQALNHLDLRFLRRQIGTVMQHSQLIIGGSIFANIAAGRELTMAQAWQAAQAAGLADEIRAMPMQMYTPLTDAGKAISSGQRQRLLIARALALNPKILFFDEATTAIDEVSQAIVLAALSDLKITRIFIAHRPSMLKHADRIIVLDKGRVVQFGSFDELKAKLSNFSDFLFDPGAEEEEKA